MPWSTLRHPGGGDTLLQFSIFVPNHLGRLHDLSQLFTQHAVHILALTVLDTTDSAILRVVVDDSDRARAILNENGFAFTEARVVAVEIDLETGLSAALAALLEAEINIHYMYAFFTRPDGRPLVAFSLEDHDVAIEALTRHQIRVLRQGDINR